MDKGKSDVCQKNSDYRYVVCQQFAKCRPRFLLAIIQSVVNTLVMPFRHRLPMRLQSSVLSFLKRITNNIYLNVIKSHTSWLFYHQIDKKNDIPPKTD